MTEIDKDENVLAERKKAIEFSKANFTKLVINDLSKSSSGRALLKKYKQSEVREIIENFKIERNQVRLREISQLLWAKSPQYQRLLNYFAEMPTYAHVIVPIKDLKSANKNKALKQYVEIGELLKTMSLRHELNKILKVAFREDIFYGYIHKEKNSFFIQQMPFDICKATSVQDGVLNYSVDMAYFQSNEATLSSWSVEIQAKYHEWKKARDINPKLSQWVELDARNTICIKVNEDMLEIFPPFAGTFDSVFDIQAFKELRKDKEKLGNYMMLSQKVPMNTNSENINDFLIDGDFVSYFHNQASDVVPENVGVITSPMEIEPINFKDNKVDTDGVGKATRDFWEDSGASQLLFSSQNNSSTGLAMSIKSDESVVFTLLAQIERWLNRYLRYLNKDLLYNVRMLEITDYNKETVYKMYLEAGQYGVPVKSFLSASVGLEPIEVMNMSYLENDLLKMHEEWIPLISSHTMGDDALGENSTGGAPKKDPTKVSDETSRGKDKPNAK